MQKFKATFFYLISFFILTQYDLKEARAFDISAYFDPISLANVYWLYGHDWTDCNNNQLYGDTTDSVSARQSVSLINQDVLRWYDEMGITILQTQR